VAALSSHALLKLKIKNEKLRMRAASLQRDWHQASGIRGGWYVALFIGVVG
jgi:hypothetical protein